jgi:hypothetical protein
VGLRGITETRLIRSSARCSALSAISRSAGKAPESRRSWIEHGAKLEGATEARKYLGRIYGLEQARSRTPLPPRPELHAAR